MLVGGASSVLDALTVGAELGSDDSDFSFETTEFSLLSSLSEMTNAMIKTAIAVIATITLSNSRKSGEVVFIGSATSAQPKIVRTGIGHNGQPSHTESLIRP